MTVMIDASDLEVLMDAAQDWAMELQHYIIPNAEETSEEDAQSCEERLEHINAAITAAQALKEVRTMNKISFTVEVETTETSLTRQESLAAELKGRVEYVLGEEFGRPGASAQEQWGADVELSGYDGPTIESVMTTPPFVEEV